METVNISLPPALKQYVEAQVNAGRFSTVSDFVGELIRADQEQRWRDDIDGKLEEALDTESRPLTSDDWMALRRDVRERLAEPAQAARNEG